MDRVAVNLAIVAYLRYELMESHRGEQKRPQGTSILIKSSLTLPDGHLEILPFPAPRPSRKT